MPLTSVEFCVDGQHAIDKTNELLKEAIAKGEKKPISLMLLDFCMPRKNG